jgi:malonyl-CoA O-methyltransferase
MSDPFQLDRDRVRRSFDGAAGDYDEAAVLQREIGRRLMQRYDYIKLKARRVIDLGCGTGAALEPLSRRFRGAEMIAVDFAQGMLDRTPDRVGGRWPFGRRVRRVCAEAECLPIPDASVDLIHSNLMLQWCDDLPRVFAEVRRVLRPGGLFSFSSFGPDTLMELRAAWAQVDDAVHVNRFADMHDVGDALLRSGLAEPVMDTEVISMRYRSVADLMRDLKSLGARNANQGRARGLAGRGRLLALADAYEAFRDDAALPATYEIVYGHCWGAAPKQSANADGSIAVPISTIGRTGR